jgi:hypothetical protein
MRALLFIKMYGYTDTGKIGKQIGGNDYEKEIVERTARCGLCGFDGSLWWKE